MSINLVGLILRIIDEHAKIVRAQITSKSCPLDVCDHWMPEIFYLYFRAHSYHFLSPKLNEVVEGGKIFESSSTVKNISGDVFTNDISHIERNTCVF